MKLMTRCILHTDDSATPVTKEQAADWDVLKKMCGCELFDLVRLPDGWIMLVDDEGLLFQKPLNIVATELYRSVCRPGMQDGIIVGSVALVKDGDFD